MKNPRNKALGHHVVILGFFSSPSGHIFLPLSMSKSTSEDANLWGLPEGQPNDSESVQEFAVRKFAELGLKVEELGEFKKTKI